MAKIDEIDYDELVRGASEIARLANEMQNSIKQGFSEMDAMREVWFGQSYDNFVGAVNLQVAVLNKLFEVLVSDIPHEIAAKAKSYASSQQTTVGAGFTEQTAIILSEITKTNKAPKLRFKTEQVNSCRETIKNCFKKASEAATSAKEKAAGLAPIWQSISGDTNILELTSGFQRIINGNDTLMNILDGAITQQSNTIEALETAANVVEGAKNLVSDGIEAGADAIESFKEKAADLASDVWQSWTGKD